MSKPIAFNSIPSNTQPQMEGKKPVSKIDQLLKHPIVGNAYHDSDIMDQITQYAADPKNTLSNRLKALRQIDVIMGVEEEPYPTEKDLKEYLEFGDIPYVPSIIKESMNQLHKQFIYNITESNYSAADKQLEQLVESKIRERVQASLQDINEGLFDRLGAKASGLGAGLKAKAQNLGTRLVAKPKAALQAAAGAATGTGFDKAANTLKQAETSVAANDPRKKAKAAQANSLLSSFAKDLSTLYPDVNAQKVLKNLRMQLNLSKA